jgi:thiol-disulfide isomerase/thioredoxin
MIRADAGGCCLIVELARVALAGVLVVAGVGKLADREGSRESIVAFGAPARVAAAVGWALLGTELAIAMALLLDPFQVFGAAAGLALLAVVSAAVAANLIRGRAPVCNCFGQFSREQVGWSTLARNGLLASVAAYIAFGGREPGLLAGIALLCGLVWVALGPLQFSVRRGAAAPGFVLTDAVGATWTLRTLLAAGRPALLVFSQPGCGACRALRSDLLDWHARLGDRLTVAVVDHTPQAEPAEYPVLLDPDGGVASSYRVTATPSAVLIESSGGMASAVARGASEIEALVAARFEHDDSPRFARRTLIVRVARGATTLGAFPLLAAACGSSSSSSSTPASASSTATTTAPRAALRVGSAYICQQKYALCTNAPCRPDPHNSKVVICDCVVKNGYSVGLTSCPRRAPHGSTLYSTFSTALVTGSVRAMTCGAHVAWANCVDAICQLDPNDATKATCQCPLVKTGPSFTLGGDCDTGTCGKTVWSGAHTNLGGPQVAAAMKRLGQPLATPQPCPKS